MSNEQEPLLDDSLPVDELTLKVLRKSRQEHFRTSSRLNQIIEMGNKGTLNPKKALEMMKNVISRSFTEGNRINALLSKMGREDVEDEDVIPL